MNRRDFLITTSAATLFPRIAFASAPVELVAQAVTAQILPKGEPATPMLGFNGSTPGPVLRARQGEVFDIRFLNQIGEGSAVHWHGLRLDNAMDGVPGMTQDVVERGEEFRYRFRAPDAGTFWYHSHNRSWEQVAKGLYGPLIVEEPTPPDVDHDLIVMIDDWRMTKNGTLADGFENRHDQAHQGRLGNFARTLVEPATPVRRGDRVRLRLINVATDRIFPLELEGVKGKVVALDGMPLASLQDLSDLILAPAQRADIIADVTSAAAVESRLPDARRSLPVGGNPGERGEYHAATLRGFRAATKRDCLAGHGKGCFPDPHLGRWSDEPPHDARHDGGRHLGVQRPIRSNGDPVSQL